MDISKEIVEYSDATRLIKKMVPNWWCEESVTRWLDACVFTQNKPREIPAPAVSRHSLTSAPRSESRAYG